jgi:UDP-N-acetylmuramoyl-L-alanyl-D-glutamate--2,6-diaminopimelate ligase
LERVSEGEGFEVFVDYAHTDDALRSVISVLRRLTTGRLIVVFGCGGDRDAGKRPAMGAAAAVADVVVVTSDNPRSEDPAAIIADILRGVGDRSALVESDRREAIRAAIAMCAPGDVLLVAGKGHETTQTVGDTVLPFDDRAVCRALLVERRERAR